MVGRSLETHAVHKMIGLVLGAAGLAAFGVAANAPFGLDLPLPTVVAAAGAGALGGRFVPTRSSRPRPTRSGSCSSR